MTLSHAPPAARQSCTARSLHPSPTTTPDPDVDSVSMGPGGRLLESTAARLRRVVPYDAAAWFGTDPVTILPTSPVRIDNVPTGGCEAYWDGEFTGEDVLLFRDLARSSSGAGTLYDATEGLPSRSRRYRDLLAPRGFGDELRATLRIGRSTWAVVDLFRGINCDPFTAQDLEKVTALGAEVAMSLAGLATAQRSSVSQTVHDGPGTALFDGNGDLVSLDAQAERWLSELTSAPWGEPASHPLMAPIWSLLARARAVATRRERGPASVRLRGLGGRWIVVHASCLRRVDGRPGLVAIMIEPANSSQIAPIIVEAYGLTPREQQVTQGVAQGFSNLAIATELFVSVHTVRDHLKTVFAKLSVTSRGELIAKIFAEHYAPAGHDRDADTAHVAITGSAAAAAGPRWRADSHSPAQLSAR
jgi:DNA-binding CsgD family transcriptional regulator